MSTIVRTTAGEVEGYQKHGLSIFKGIPYATPPVGTRRWLPPEPVEPWAGVRQAELFATAAPQNPMGLEFIAPGEEPEPQNEDCLYLNIWTPGIDDKRRPVLFWIHGGGFTAGSGSSLLYNGRTLSQRGDAVVVTINYRLGALGFLNLDAVTGGKIPATGNEGLLDQVAALEWVRDNIAAFGGDPSNITIFGESAGGMSVGCLLGMSRAHGLFHKAIPQSGAASTASSLDTAVQVARIFLDVVDLTGDDVDDLRSLTVDQLLTAQKDVMARVVKEEPTMGMPIQPVIDGKVLPQLPIDSVRNGSADGIPILVGSNLDEWKLFGATAPGTVNLDEASLLRRCQQLIPGEHAARIVEAYRQVRTERGVATTPGELFMAIQTDRGFRIPAIRLAEAQHKRGFAAYCYLFTWESPLLGGVLGACHALELGFLWGTYEENFSGTGAEADTLASRMQDAWLSFARTGDPGCESLGTWPAYGGRRPTMMLGKECLIKEAPYDEERCAWEAVDDAATSA